MTCDQCLEGHHNLCAKAEPTIVSRHGGFADKVRAQAASVAKLPDELDAKKAGPLLCGGMAVFNPLAQCDMSPTGSVGVSGIGGLGHLALQFARAWGCHVTAFTSSGPKQQEAIDLGAHDTINSRDPEAIKAAAGRFDLLLSTVNVKLDWNSDKSETIMGRIERFRPDPIPVIHPMPEYLATGQRAKWYEDTKQVLQVPWMGVVTMAYAHYPTF